MKTKLSVFLLTVTISISFGEIINLKDVDSLWFTYYNKLLADTTRLQALHQLAFQFYFTNPDSGIILSNSLIDEAKEKKFKSLEAKGYSDKGLNYWAQGNYAEALKNYLNYLKICEDIGDQQGIGYSYNFIGRLYSDQSNYSESMKNFLNALNILNKISDKQGIGDSYMGMGVNYAYQKIYPEALKYYFSSLKIRQEIGDGRGIAVCYNNIGDVFYHQGNYIEAEKNHHSALRIFEEMKNKRGVASSYINIAEINIKFKKLSIASNYLEKGLQISNEIRSKYQIRECYNDLTILDSLKGNFKLAFEHHKMYILYRDSLTNEANAKKTVQTQMQFEFDKKESLTKAEQDKKDAIALKEVQKQKLVRNGFVGGFAVMLLFAGVFFTQRNKIKKGKKLSDDLLLNILPSEVAEELKQKGSAEAKQFDDVTVMFTDFKDFTQISEKFSPAELVAEIDTCFKAFDNIMGKYNIEKIKTIGDSYMCAGGLPVPNKTNATDVVKAALEIQQFMHEHAERKKRDGKDVFEIRIGVHTGPVVAGIVGVKKYSYDIWGDTVNIASRMESSGEAGKVNVSGATFELVKDKFNCKHRGKIEAKNKGMIDMYFVESDVV